MNYYAKLLSELKSSGAELYDMIERIERLESEHPFNNPFPDAVKRWGVSCACIPLNEAQEAARLWVVCNLLQNALIHIEHAEAYWKQKANAEAAN